MAIYIYLKTNTSKSMDCIDFEIIFHSLQNQTQTVQFSLGDRSTRANPRWP